ncbi:MAG: HAD family hydrolase, partial [Clostridia bacterium]|nr:HAD family hydrolase [Clostridia bacterium]
MYKMILTDLDHTLLRSDGSVSEKTLSILDKCRQQGMLLAIATARYWIGAEKLIRQLRPDYEITTDGTLIHSNDTCVYSCSFSIEKTNAIVTEILRQVPDSEITVASGKTVLWNSKHIAESERLYKAQYCEYDIPVSYEANKIAAELPNEETAYDIAAKTGSRLQCYRGENLYAFLPPEAGKTQAIKEMVKISHIQPGEIVSFGDDKNDIEMLKICGKGIAV